MASEFLIFAKDADAVKLSMIVINSIYRCSSIGSPPSLLIQRLISYENSYFQLPFSSLNNLQ